MRIGNGMDGRIAEVTWYLIRDHNMNTSLTGPARV